MATTTWDAIRDQMIATIRGLTPSALSEYPFDRSPPRWPVRKWATRNATTAVLRKFEIVRVGATDQPLLIPMTQIQRNETALITVAYPIEPSLYGEHELDDLEKVIRSDARQIHDAVFSYGNYVAGQHAAFVTIEEPERSDEHVWFQPFSVRVIYDEALSLAP